MGVQGRKPFRIASDWVYYAHGDSPYDTARELCARVESSGGAKWVNIYFVHQVREIVSAAELYTGRSYGDAEDKAVSRRASDIVRRGKTWLAEFEQSGE